MLLRWWRGQRCSATSLSGWLQLMRRQRRAAPPFAVEDSEPSACCSPPPLSCSRGPAVAPGSSLGSAAADGENCCRRQEALGVDSLGVDSGGGAGGGLLSGPYCLRPAQLLRRGRCALSAALPDLDGPPPLPNWPPTASLPLLLPAGRSVASSSDAELPDLEAPS